MGDQFFMSIFPDMPNELMFDELKDIQIQDLKLLKKSNVIQLTMLISKPINLENVLKIEKYIAEKLSLSEANISLKYTSEKKLTVEDINFEEIFSYLAFKFPSVKGMLNTKQIETESERIDIKLDFHSKEILELKRIDKAIECVILSNYGIKCKVNFIDGEIIHPDENFEKEIITNILKNETKKDETTKIEGETKSDEKSDIIYGRGNIKEELCNVTSLNPESGKVALQGEIFNVDSRELKSGKHLLVFDIYDGSSTITVKTFLQKEELKETVDRLKNASRVKISGNVQYDPFAKELGVIVNNIIELPKKPARKDNAENKRVELHLHTQMSSMDGMTSASDLVKNAAKWGHKAVAITDHGVVQSFPEAHQAAKKNGIKILYGLEGYLISDKTSTLSKTSNLSLDTTYIVLDIETTGLSAINDKITEFGMIKIVNGEAVDQFESFVNPEVPISEEITRITGITDDMVKDAPTISEIMPKVLEFIGDNVIVAHNANFDMRFIKYNAKLLDLQINNVVIDTLQLSRDMYPNFNKHKLGTIASNLGIKVDVAHRALDDVKTLVKIFNVMLNQIKEKGGKRLQDLDNIFKENFSFKNAERHHITILVKNYTGLKNLYKLVSLSHLEYFYKKPCILKSILKEYSDGLIIGTACEQGELYKAILKGMSDVDLGKIVFDYDYLEIMPDDNNEFLIRSGYVKDKEALHDINKKIIQLGDKHKKIVVATGDVHFLNPEDEVYRRILMSGQGYDDADMQAPLYFKTTDEMLEEFKYLGEEKAYEVVVSNTNLIADMCDEIQPVPDGTYPPKIEGAEEEIEKIAYSKAKEIYGDPLPEIVRKRLEKELNSIIKNGFSVMYIIAQKLVWKSNEDGYLVGSRGSVGSSFAATMTGITEVNPLPPHYVCPKCKHSEFFEEMLSCGFDLPDKKCPKCGEELKKDGVDIPFETFLGFDGDKAPDIDLNFSGEYQAKAHAYTEELFGKGKVFKAGTIGTVADKTAYGFVKKYYEEKNVYAFNAEIGRIAKGCVGVKRTTGQHPGGIIVVPDYKDIYDFCPIQHPADATESDIITTHFDFHSIHDNLLKLDILGHDDPTVIKMLEDLTGIDAKTIPLDDKETMSIFRDTKALGVTPEQINSTVGSFAVPEFGTKFVRQMLVDTKPTTFSELIRISGLSHGTDVWLNNAQTLILEGTANLSEVICTRDDIMLYLINRGLAPKMAFKIMESVRKGKGLTEEMEQAMNEQNIPKWYIKSCKTIKYMFPKAHAAAYVTMAFRIAWFKVHYPEAFYTAYFSVRADDFDANIMIKGKELVKNKIKEIEMQGNNASTKDKNVLTILEVVNEMYERGIKFLPIDLKKSHAKKFLMESEGIRPPLNSIPGLGTVAAEGIFNAIQNAKIDLTVDDLRLQAKIGKSVIELLEKEGCLRGMLKTNQFSLF